MKKTPLKRKVPLRARTPLKAKTPLRAKTPLKSYTPLKATKGLNRVSKKQAKENAEWAKIKAERIKALKDRHGYLVCEYCTGKLYVESADAHHNDWNRNNNIFENARIVSRICHTLIHDNNIKNIPSLL